MNSAINIGRLLDQASLRQPQSLALIDLNPGYVKLTWSQLYAAACAVQRALSSDMVAKGDPVILISKNSWRMTSGMWGIIRSGAVIVPINFKATAHEISYMASLTGARTIICDNEFVTKCAEAASQIQNTINVRNLSDYLPNGAPQEPLNVSETVSVSYDDPVWYFFTSGTTGKPKAAMLTHGQMSFVINNHLADLIPGTTENDVSLAVAPLSHGAGVHMLVNTAKAALTILSNASSFSACDVLDTIADHRVTNMFTVPTIVKLLTEAYEATPRDISSLRYIVYAGAPMYRDDQQRALKAFGKVFVQYYGLAEVTGCISYLPADMHSTQDNWALEGSCGIVRTGMDVTVVDPHTREPLQSGETGEICAKGNGVFKGYLNNEAATSSVMHDGWFHTGDLGHVNEFGYLFVTGRKSDMYISGGMNVYPREIEEILLRHTDVSECAVLGVEHEKWGEMGVAIVVLKDASVTPAALNDYLRKYLTPYKLPKAYLLTEAINKTAYGKVSKKELRENIINSDSAQLVCV